MKHKLRNLLGYLCIVSPVLTILILSIATGKIQAVILAMLLFIVILIGIVASIVIVWCGFLILAKEQNLTESKDVV